MCAINESDGRQSTLIIFYLFRHFTAAVNTSAIQRDYAAASWDGTALISCQSSACRCTCHGEL